ncbi:uncharacterized protein A1O9_00820 [Exophiala aquamarina CBS 119918]|uniref:C-CAP/cofactor C-like domain-containing protein n=1 Tax=Exophiala aquamarina CBS 119918 TaxID=1182545 RepID=A0A072PSZ0_9EURO|nr:uncharacterized protein A1O9_00820 [Exophiala aquamarina CBS 119918]KEF62847.1 hypothetical protein A1O9_00820 [Exophiala aquamarina CBS 119918]
MAELSNQQRFFHYFQQEITGIARLDCAVQPYAYTFPHPALQEQMNHLADTALIGGERSDASDHCLAGITRLSAEVKDASNYLPSYDQRTYAEAIKALQEKFEESKKLHAPKPKFSFKSAHKSPSALSLSDAAEMAAQKRRDIPGHLSPNFQDSPTPSFPNTPAYVHTPPNEKSSSADQTSSNTGDLNRTASKEGVNPSSSTKDRPSLSTTATSISIRNQTNTHIILPSSALHSQTPCNLQQLTSCVVDLSVPSTATSPFASLTINSASSSLLICGSVSGPAHITGVKNSVIVLKARQLRMHECENIDVYLHCSSRPIIEDCKGIRLSPLPKFQSELLPSPKDGAEPPNQWDQVDDFKWIKSEPSPNWSILPPEANIPDETWREVVPGGPGWSTLQILNAVGIGG